MAEITFDTVSGNAKRVYDSAIKDLRPKSAIITNRASWEKGTRNIGESYQVPIALRPPNGFTYAGSNGLGAGSGALALKAGRPMVIKPASCTPFELDLREQIMWVALSRMADSGEGAIASLFGEVMKAMKVSAANRLEIAILNGQRGLGTIETVTDNTTTADLKITAATWRPGLWWALGEGTTLDSFTSTTKNNASGAVVLAGVKAATREITVTWTGTLASEITAGDVLYFEGAYDGTSFYEMPGLLSQAANVSGTSMGIAAGTYSNWKGNTKSISANFGFDALEEVCGELRDRGATGKLTCYAPNKTYGELMSELRTQRILDQSYSPTNSKTGFAGVEFETKDFGAVELINHPFMSWGEVYLQDDGDVARVGSSDLTFGVPGMSGEKLLRLGDGYNYVESILFTDQCSINKGPNHSYLVTGVTHT